MIVDAGYDPMRLAYRLSDLPVQVLGRLRSDRVLHFPAPPRRRDGKPGRPPRHGSELKLADERTWPAPHVTTVTATTRYGTAVACSWDRLHPRLASRSAWLDHDGPLPVIEGTLIRLAVDPKLSSQALAELIGERFGVRVHRRSVERALARAERAEREERAEESEDD